ncbi:ribonuclease H family protein [Microvirga roseola]|uniref:ribonuclease H family protein n=1 Tax=Microvirga roseola TaxID=2883126 RepID=UPI001E341A1E|nr:ribonuclease H [Microvirga roseola]
MFLVCPLSSQFKTMRRNNHSSNEAIGGKPLADTYVVYADGSSLHNPGPAGWAVLIIQPDGRRETLVGSEALATNNAMELRAAIEALNALPQDAYGIIHCDSEYVVKGVTEWRRGWEARRWRNSKGQPVANAGLWQILFKLSDEHPSVRFQWVRGHAGDEGNELVDTLARTEAEKVRSGLPPISGRTELDSPGETAPIKALKPLGMVATQ